MADSDKDLKIRIKTTADLAAVQETTTSMKEVGAAIESTAAAAKDSAAALEQVSSATETTKAKTAETVVSVEDLAKQFVTANEKADEWGKTISKLNNEQLLQLEERLRADIEAADALGQSTDALKKKLSETYSHRTNQLEETFSKGAKAAGSLAKGVEEVNTRMRSTRQTAEGFKNILTGLSAGSLAGLLQAGRGVQQVFSSIGTTIAGVGGVVLRLIPVVGAGATAIYLMRQRAEENRAAMTKMGDEAEASAKRLTAAFEEIEKAAVKSAKAQSEAIEKLTADYDEYLARLEKGNQRIAEQNKLVVDGKVGDVDRAEQSALSAITKRELSPGLSTEERDRLALDRERITRQADQRRKEIRTQAEIDEITTQARTGRQTISENDKRGVQLQSQRDVIDRDLAEKRRAFEDAAAAARAAIEETDSGSPRTREAQEDAKTAERALKQAEERVKELRAKIEAESKRLATENDDARATIATAEQRARNKITDLETENSRRENESVPERSRLRRDAQAAMERGDNNAQNKAVAQLQQLQKEESDAKKANTAATKELTNTLKADAPRERPPTPPAVTIKSVDDERVSPREGTIQRIGEKPIEVKPGELVQPRPTQGGTIQRSGEKPVTLKPGELLEPKADKPTLKRSSDEPASKKEEAPIADEESASVDATQENTAVIAKLIPAIRELVSALQNQAAAAVAGGGEPTDDVAPVAPVTPDVQPNPGDAPEPLKKRQPSEGSTINGKPVAQLPSQSTIQKAGDAAPVPLDEAAASARETAAAARRAAQSTVDANKATGQALDVVAESNKQAQKKANLTAKQVANAR